MDAHIRLTELNVPCCAAPFTLPLPPSPSNDDSETPNRPQSCTAHSTPSRSTTTATSQTTPTSAAYPPASTATSYSTLYNRREGVTAGISEYADRLVVVRQTGDDGESRTVAPLSPNSRYTQSNWGGTGHTLVIHFCRASEGTPDYAAIVLFLEGRTHAVCGTAAPTTPPPTTRSGLFDPSVNVISDTPA